MSNEWLFALLSMMNLAAICHYNSEKKFDTWDWAARIINGLVALIILIRGFIR